MTHAAQLPFCFDPVKLQQDLDRIPADSWIPHFNQDDYDGGWSIVALYSPTGASDFIYPMQADNFVLRETPLLAECTYLKEVVESFRCPKSAVRLLNLHAGSRIREHDDPRLRYADGQMRLHIPIQTNPGVECILGGHRLVMKPGECWYADFTLPHSVTNDSAADRVHLVIDCEVNDWLRDLFTSLRLADRSE